MSNLLPRTPGEVRWATADDAEELVRLRRLMFEAMGVATTNDAWEQSALELFLTDLGTDRMQAAVVDAPDGTDCLAATGVVQFESRLPSPKFRDPVKAYISSMSTDPRWQRRGYANLIVAELLGMCRARDVKVVDLHATVAGRSVYERNGFALKTGDLAREMRWAPETA